jgi:phage regulator Rha-like protein
MLATEQNIFKVYFIRYIMFEWLFGNKKDIESVKEETKKSFELVKKDVANVSGWIKHLDSEKKLQNKEIEDIKEILSSVQEELDGLKNVVSIMGNLKSGRNFTQLSKLSNKQTAVQVAQTAVQTAVQTPNLDVFSITERAILWVLLNSDMKLSYEDIAAMLGKERSTIRSQINGIKQKSDGLIEELIEKNGKKRVFIPENMKEILLKKVKVRVNNAKNIKKNGKTD